MFGDRSIGVCKARTQEIQEKNLCTRKQSDLLCDWPNDYIQFNNSLVVLALRMRNIENLGGYYLEDDRE